MTKSFRAVPVILACLVILAFGFFAALPLKAQTPTPGMPEATPPQATPAGPGVVRGYLFHSPTCPHCRKVIQEVLPRVQEKYGSRFELTLLDITNPSNYLFLRFIEDQAKVPKEMRGVPFLVIGHHIIVGDVNIDAGIEEVIDFYLKQGGVDYPILPPDKIDEVFKPPTPQPTRKNAPLVHIAYFYTTGCNECEQAYYDLEHLKRQYPTVRIHEFDVTKDAPLWEWLGEKRGIPEEKRLTTPAVFVGEDYLLGEDVDFENLKALVEKYKDTGAEAFWEGWDKEEATQSILQRFRSLGPLTVAAAGLIDGLNPCAFATLIFFISYLAFTGRRGWEILAVGGAFTAGISLAYIGIGVGFLRAFQALPWLQSLSKVIYGVTAVLCLALAAGSIRDLIQLKRGRPEEMKLRMPSRLRRTVNRIIRQSMRTRFLVPTSLVTGLVISLIEFTCTGQVYLPTIIFVMGVPEMRARALLYLLEYNLFFILPLVVIFVIAFFGTTSEELGRFLNRNLFAIKAATAVLFLVLGGWLVYATLA